MSTPQPDEEAVLRWLLEVPLDKRPAVSSSMLMEMFNWTVERAFNVLGQANAIRGGVNNERDP